MFVTYPPHIREKAITLRHDGMTIDEIAERLAPISRTTIFYWVGQIEIERKPATGWPDSARRRGNAAMREKYMRIRELAYNAGRHGFHCMATHDPSFRDFVSLYIGEGYKRDRNTVALGNSDPCVVELAHRWISRLTKNKIDCAVQHHADQDVPMLREFWGDRLGVRPDSIRAQRKSNSSQLSGRKWRSKFGVLSVRVGDTRLRALLEGWMDEMKDSWLDSAIRSSGRSEAWSSRGFWGAEIPGSNPGAPTSPVQESRAE